MRNALAKTLYELAKEDDRIVVIVADISPAGAMDDFRREFPTRFINTGVAETSMIGLAAGLAQRGFKPFCYTIATFALFRAYEFVRCDLAYQNLNVILIGMGAGLAYSTLGGTHQATEDVAVAMACPGMTVIAPCDPRETVQAVRWCAARDAGGPVYLRLGKAGEPDLGGSSLPGTMEDLRWLRGGILSGTYILTYGPIAVEALKLADMLGGEGVYPDVAVASVRSLRPLNTERISDILTFSSISGGRVIVLEEAAGAPLYREVLDVAHRDVPLARVLSFALPREFCHKLGSRQDLLEYYGLTAEKIIEQL